MARFTIWCCGSKRRCEITDSSTFLAAAASTIRRASAAFMAIGFSITTCLPAAMAASARRAWLPLDEVMATRSSSGRRTSSSGSVVKAQPGLPSSFATWAACSARRDEIAATRAPSSLNARMCIRPMLPAPTIPTVVVAMFWKPLTTFTGPLEAAILPAPMKIFLGSDHAGVKLRKQLWERLRGQGHDAVDFGPDSEAPVDYPDWAARVGRAVRGESGAVGVLVCGSGIGVSMAANKLRGVRAVAPWNTEAARLSRAHNDANVLCLGARLLPDGDVDAILDVWLTTPFEGGRHGKRVAKMAALELAEIAEALVEVERERL